MGFFQHLEELRWTLIKCAITYLVFAAAIGFFLKEFNDLLLWPLTSVKSWVAIAIFMALGPVQRARMVTATSRGGAKYGAEVTRMSAPARA